MKKLVAVTFIVLLAGCAGMGGGSTYSSSGSSMPATNAAFQSDVRF